MRKTFADFEVFVNLQTNVSQLANAAKEANTIRIGQLPSELIGNGTEYLIRNGLVIAKFFNGNFVGVIPKGNSSQTLSAA